LGLPIKENSPSDNLILCNFQQQRIALLVDHVEMVKDCDEVIREGNALQCILKNEEQITILCDLEKLIPNRLLTIG
jgi:chemotaxis signal transduction protein